MQFASRVSLYIHQHPQGRKRTIRLNFLCPDSSGAYFAEILRRKCAIYLQAPAAAHGDIIHLWTNPSLKVNFIKT